MNASPVILRELRVEARRPLTMWLRLLGGAVAVLILAVLALERRNEPGQWGQELFTTMHVTLFFGAWVFGPVLAADCLSRERREGTLGLLFLTPLTPRAVVVAKGIVHGLRGFGLLLAAVPVMTTPFLLGGVTWEEAVLSALLNLEALSVALAAGVWASSRCRHWLRSLVLAEAASAAALAGFAVVQGFAVVTLALMLNPALVGHFEGEDWNLAWVIPAVGGVYSLNAGTAWTDIATTVGLGGMAAWIWLQVGFLPVCAGVLWFVVGAASRRLARSLADEPPSARQQWWLRTFCTPQFWQGFFQSRLRQALERNPVGWLHQRLWTARLGKWAWCFVVVFVESILTMNASLMVDVMPFRDWHAALALALMLGLSASAAGSFRVERENGMLELMLVAPLRVRTILFGRLVSIWWQFLPAVAAFGVVWFAMSGELLNRPPGLGCLTVAAYLGLPAIGLLFSLRLRSFLAAWGATILLGITVPWGLNAIGAASAYQRSPIPPLNFGEQVGAHLSFLLGVIWLLGMGLASLARLQRLLAQRRFARP